MAVKEKNQYFQILRGISIILVILIHCYTGFNYEKTTFSYNFYMFFRSAMGIAVPVFFALSGYFSAHKEAKTEKPTFFDMRLIIPFLVWSLIYQIYGNGAASLLTPKGIVKIITGQSAAHLYFIFVLLQIRLIIPFLSKHKGKLLTAVIIAMSVLYFSLHYPLNVFGIIKNPTPFNLTDFFPAWLIYWYIGYMAKTSGFAKRLNLKCLAAVTSVTYLLTVAESYYLAELMRSNDSINPVSQVKISNLFFCVAFVLLIFRLERNVAKRNLLSRIGDISYGIYYIHFLVIFTLKKFADIWQTIPLAAVYVIELSVTLAVSIIIIKITQKITGKSLSSSVFGF